MLNMSIVESLQEISSRKVASLNITPPESHPVKEMVENCYPKFFIHDSSSYVIISKYNGMYKISTNKGDDTFYIRTLKHVETYLHRLFNLDDDCVSRYFDISISRDEQTKNKILHKSHAEKVVCHHLSEYLELFDNIIL